MPLCVAGRRSRLAAYAPLSRILRSRTEGKRSDGRSELRKPRSRRPANLFPARANGAGIKAPPCASRTEKAPGNKVAFFTARPRRNSAGVSPCARERRDEIDNFIRRFRCATVQSSELLARDASSKALSVPRWASARLRRRSIWSSWPHYSLIKTPRKSRDVKFDEHQGTFSSLGTAVGPTFITLSWKNFIDYHYLEAPINSIFYVNKLSKVFFPFILWF